MLNMTLAVVAIAQSAIKTEADFWSQIATVNLQLPIR